MQFTSGTCRLGPDSSTSEESEKANKLLPTEVFQKSMGESTWRSAGRGVPPPHHGGPLLPPTRYNNDRKGSALCSCISFER